MVERVLDAVIVTEKAPLIRTHLTQVKGRQRQAPCGGRDREEGERSKVGKGSETETPAIEKQQSWRSALRKLT